MEKEEIFELAQALLRNARAGDYTRAQYAECRARLFRIQGAEALAGALELALQAGEGDPADPFGGWCFRWEGEPPWLKREADGRARVDPVALARYVQAHSHIMNFEAGNGSFARYYYEDGVYRPCGDERLRERLQAEIFSYDPGLYKSRYVTEAAGILAQATPAGPLAMLDADEGIVNFRNGLLDLKTMTLSAHTPEVLSTVQLDAEWTDKDAPAPVFSAFMKQLCGGNTAKVRLLMQFMGLALTNVPGWRTKQALFMFGAGNTGKSVARSLLESILGEGNYANLDLSSLEEDRFSTAQLVGKRLAGTGDMRFLRVREMSVFKQLTGGDRLYAQYKGKDPFSFRFNGLLWFSMNEPPRFGGDKGDWVYRRMILFPCRDTVEEGKQDPLLLQKLLAERNAIARKLLYAAKSVVEAGYRFDAPQELEREREAYQTENDPVRTFLAECCEKRESREISPLDECTCKNVFEVFKLWCRDNNGGYVPRKSEFRRTAAQVLGMPEDEMVIRGRQNNYYCFRLREEAKRDYEGQIFVKSVEK